MTRSLFCGKISSVDIANGTMDAKSDREMLPHQVVLVVECDYLMSPTEKRKTVQDRMDLHPDSQEYRSG